VFLFFETSNFISHVSFLRPNHVSNWLAIQVHSTLSNPQKVIKSRQGFSNTCLFLNGPKNLLGIPAFSNSFQRFSAELEDC
jgi:hypothetical protein